MRIPLLILIAIITFVIVLMVNNPDLVHKFWLWAVGLAGVILQLFISLWQFLKNIFSKGTSILKSKTPEPKK